MPLPRPLPLLLLGAAGPCGAFLDGCLGAKSGQQPRVEAKAAPLKIWFGYTKSEMACFRDGSLEALIGSSASGRLFLEADMVVLLELARRPSREDLFRDGQRLRMEVKSCEEEGGVPLDEQVWRKLAGLGRELVQVHQYAEDDPTSPDMALLSVWYRPERLSPGPALAYKNSFGGRRPEACVAQARPRYGAVNVSADLFASECPEAASWPQYRSSKASLATSWLLRDDGTRFAVWGANLPALYAKGKNAMVQRTFSGIAERLHVSADKVLVLGDMNTRLLDSAWEVCELGCVAPDSAEQRRELAAQPWESIPGRTEAEGDIKPCAKLSRGGFNSSEDCRAARSELMRCRQRCLGLLGCDGDYRRVAGEFWRSIDPKRGAGGFDLLPETFTFLQDVEVRATARGAQAGNYRAPSYKRRMDGDVATCRRHAPFHGFCPDNPCQRAALLQSSTESCVRDFGACLAPATVEKADRIPDADPVSARRGQRLLHPQLGWLDALGLSRALAPGMEVLMLEDRDLTFGDHQPLVAALLLDLGDRPVTRLSRL